MIVTHPTVEGVECDVPDSQTQAWVDSGWIAATVTSTPTASPTQGEAAPEVTDEPRPSNPRKKV